MNIDRFNNQVKFLLEIDKIKLILRRNLLIDGTRRENDAEHSWHLVMMAIIFAEHLKEVDYDLLKVVKMVAIHDIVEIYAGDVFAYDTEGLKSKVEAEIIAANRVFGLLPKDQCEEYTSLWWEFEQGKSIESKIAGVYDRFQPELNNYYTNGQIWLSNKVTYQKILDRNAETEAIFPAIWEHLNTILRDALERDILKKEY